MESISRTSAPKNFSLISLISLLVIILAGCVPLPVLKYKYAYTNQPLTAPSNTTHARTDQPPPYDYFIGLALSGGGSRAANFSAAVMWELHRLGVLEHVHYISAVSGSALPAAYYALFKNDSSKWNKETLQKTMAQCFECWGVAYLLNPFRFVKFIGTSYDRTDVMAEVFKNRVFDSRTFERLQDTPRLILNATNYITGGPFVFTNEAFDRDGLKSDLSKLQIAEGVMASAAYPGGFRNVTLKNFRRSEEEGTVYLHLFDGGMSDNLGIDSVLHIHETLVRTRGSTVFPKGCLLIMVDAFTPYFEKKAETEPDTRRVRDLIIDSNALNAFSILLDTKRRKTLEALGFDESNWRDAAAEAQKQERPMRTIGLVRNLKVASLVEQRHESDEAFFEKRSFEERSRVQQERAKCKVWHIGLTQIRLSEAPRLKNWPKLPELYEPQYTEKYQQALGESYEEFEKRLLGVPTRFWISAKNARAVRAAAELLVREPNTKHLICTWLYDLTNDKCRP